MKQYQANVTEYVGQMELSFTTDENINWHNHFGKHWIIHTKPEHKHTPRCKQFHYKEHNPQKYICSSKRHTRIFYRSTIHCSSKLETTYTFTNSRTDNLWCIQSYNGTEYYRTMRMSKLCYALHEWIIEKEIFWIRSKA